MSRIFDELEAQARRLSIQERARLAEALLESLQDVSPADVEAAWEREIDERVAAYDCGESQTYPADEVFGESRHLTR